MLDLICTAFSSEIRSTPKTNNVPGLKQSILCLPWRNKLCVSLPVWYKTLFYVGRPDALSMATDGESYQVHQQSENVKKEKENHLLPIIYYGGHASEDVKCNQAPETKFEFQPCSWCHLHIRSNPSWWIVAMQEHQSRDWAAMWGGKLWEKSEIVWCSGGSNAAFERWALFVLKASLIDGKER